MMKIKSKGLLLLGLISFAFAAQGMESNDEESKRNSSSQQIIQQENLENMCAILAVTINDSFSNSKKS